MNKVILSDTEMYFSEIMAKKMLEIARANGAQEMMVRQDPLGITLQGIRSEMSFARISNLFYDMNYNEHRHVDFKSPDGHAIDVKSTSRRMSSVIVPKWNHHHEIDIYCLMIGEGDTWEYMGYCSKKNIINPEHWNTNIPSPAYLMSISDPLFHKAVD